MTNFPDSYSWTVLGTDQLGLGGVKKGIYELRYPLSEAIRQQKLVLDNGYALVSAIGLPSEVRRLSYVNLASVLLTHFGTCFPVYLVYVSVLSK